MRLIRSFSALVVLAFATACDEGFFTGIDGDDPSNLTFEIVGGDGTSAPTGILLSWDPPTDQEAYTYAVYGRSSTAGQWFLIGVTTSPTFHDAGPAQRQYYVAARDQDEREFGESRTVTIDLGTALPSPDSLVSITLDRGVHLSWATNAYRARPDDFRHYRVYSTTWSTAGGCASANWQLEGTSVTPAFAILGLTNGVTRCFAVTAMSRTGVESAVSRTVIDTPRYGLRHVLVDAFELKPATSGFIFHDPAAGRFGVVADGARSDIDFRIERNAAGGFTLRAMRAEVRIAPVGSGPVADLADLDVAPATGYILGTVDLQPGHAYAFRISRTDGVRYGAVRVAYTTGTHVVLDWAYQSQLGNPQLDRAE